MRPTQQLALILTATALATTPVLARPNDWNGGGWDNRAYGAHSPYSANQPSAIDSSEGRDSREGRVNAESFAADGAGATLGHGAIAVATAPGSALDSRATATFEAAVIDQLGHAGYDTIKPDPKGGQIIEIQMVRDVLVPEEAKHSPVSGSVELGASNRGSAFGLALAYDASKPRKALIETRLEARIKDRITGALLWEGHAQIVTREGDSHWNDTTIAGRLAGALFDRFPVS